MVARRCGAVARGLLSRAATLQPLVVNAEGSPLGARAWWRELRSENKKQASSVPEDGRPASCGSD